MMELTQDNYFSPEMNWKYLSNSQYHDFVATGSYPGCEARAMARLEGKFSEEPSEAMLIGSYLDAKYDNLLDEFKAKFPECFTLKGELRSGFKKAEEMIAVAEADELFSTYMAGQKQVIMTAELFGVWFKIKLDSYHPGKAIVDMKTTRSIREKVWDNGIKTSFIRAGGYIDQAAIYQAVVEVVTGEHLPFFIAALSKETIVDKEIIEIPDIEMEMALGQIKLNLEHIVALKRGDYPAKSCGVCDFCKSKKVLSAPISLMDLEY